MDPPKRTGLAHLSRPPIGPARVGSREAAAAGRSWPGTAVHALVALASLALWWVGLPLVQLQAMNDLGLISVLPAQVIAAFALIVLSFCLALRLRPLNEPLLLLHILVMIAIFYGTTSLIGDAPRFQVTWRHVGIAEVISRTGAVDPRIDAYFNWPVFFVAGAFATEVAGFESAISFVSWAPVIYNLLFLLPLLMILKAATDDRRVVWLALFFYYLTNWVGQDYFAPQPTTFFLHLVILAILLTWFKLRTAQPGPASRGSSSGGGLVHRWLAPPDSPNAASNPRQRAVLLGIVIVLYAAAVPSHQLTPFVTLACVGALVFLGRVSARGLPILMAVMLGTYISYMTANYLGGHFEQLLGAVGRVNDSLGSNISERLGGSFEHRIVSFVRLGMTLAIWVLAFAGGIRRLRAGRWDMTYALLALTPFPMLALQSYGGEMILRVYLFVLPFMVLFAAFAFFPTKDALMSPRLLLGVTLIALVLLAGFFFARYGNERMDYVTTQEQAVVAELYRAAPAGALLGAFSPDVPWKYRDYELHKYAVVTAAAVAGDPEAIADALIKAKRRESQEVYLVLTRGQAAHLEMFEGLPPGALERWKESLRASGRFRELFANEHGAVYQVAAAGGQR